MRIGRSFPVAATIVAWPLKPGIAYDGSSNSGYQTAQSVYTFTRTCNGSNRFLAVDVAILSVPGTTVTSVIDDFGGANVALSFIGAQSTVSGAGRVESWGLVAPATGTKTVQVTLSASVSSAAFAASYTNVHQTTPTEAFNSAQATNVGAADATVNVTTVADNDWVHGAVATDDASVTANQTSRNNVTGALGSGSNEDNNAAKTPAGAVTMSYTGVGALATWAIGGYALRPVEAASTALAGTCTVAFAPVATVGGAGVLAGSATIAFTPTATTAGTGALAGSAQAAFVGSATTVGAGALAGSAAATFANTAIASGAGSLAGSGTVAFAATAALAASGALAGTSATAFAGSALTDGVGALAGPSAVTFTGSATLAAAGALAGQSLVEFIGSATADLPSGGIAGASTVAFAPTATFAGTGALAGTAAISFTSAAALQGAAEIAGSATLAFINTAALAGLGTLSGTVSAVFSNTGTLVAANGDISGLASLTFSPQGVLIADAGAGGPELRAACIADSAQTIALGEASQQCAVSDTVYGWSVAVNDSALECAA